MTFAELANPGIRTQPVYEPGKPIETVARELGLDPAGIIKLASNENPHGPSPLRQSALRRAEPARRFPSVAGARVARTGPGAGCASVRARSR